MGWVRRLFSSLSFPGLSFVRHADLLFSVLDLVRRPTRSTDAARIFTAAPALARLMAHPEMEFKETGLPDVFEVTEARLAGLGGVGIGGVGGGGKQEKAKRGHGFG